jgi:hypothetical protein
MKRRLSVKRLSTGMSGKTNDREGPMYRQLRHHGNKYNKRGSGEAGRGSIRGRVDIAERLAIVDEKTRREDW